MWAYDEFIGKAKLYFGRGSGVAINPSDDASALWLLLGLEFLLRAPLAKVSPTLLAIPEGVSILHAAGFTRTDAYPKSIPTKTVVDRLTYIDPGFNKDRGKDALYLADIRNNEVHTSSATIANLDPETWLPKFLAVVEAVCNNLTMPVEDFLPAGVIKHARDLAERVDRELQKRVDQAVKDSIQHYQRLMPEEVKVRIASPARGLTNAGDLTSDRECPACKNTTAIVRMSPGATTVRVYDEEDDTIRYSTTYLVQSLRCRVCGLHLEGTASVMAAGIDRLYTLETEEDRYEGWEDRVTYEQALEIIGADQYEYENE